VFARLENFRTPVIAAVNGYALGGGCELAAACDFRIASSKALFGQPEVKLGLIPGYAGTQRLPRLIGTANALYLLLTGENIDADRAKEIGLVQMVTDADNLMIKVMDIAATISAQGPKAISMVKKTLRQGLAKDFVSAQKLEAERFGSLFKTEETTEGISAFLEKRKPNW
jgi:enoyl-CoA hydratase